jgi:pheromone shutdown protein TraB
VVRPPVALYLILSTLPFAGYSQLAFGFWILAAGVLSAAGFQLLAAGYFLTVYSLFSALFCLLPALRFLFSLLCPLLAAGFRVLTSACRLRHEAADRCLLVAATFCL